MKKLIIISLFLLLPLQTHASVAGTGGYTEVSGLLAKAIQLSQYAVQQVTNAANVAMKIKQVVTDPMTALFGSNASKQLESETKRWLMSGFEGDPLLVLNPEAYIKNTQTNALRNQIALLEANKTAATEGMIINLIKQRRGELSKGSPEPKDATPTRIQNSLCDNNGLELQKIIEESSGPIELGEAGQGNDFNTMYNDLCMGDVKTPDVQKKLLAIEKNSNYFSWDTWLSRTVEGNNDYTRGVLTALEVKRRTEEAAKLAANESKSGFLPDKRCIEKRPAQDDVGNPIEGAEDECIAYETLKPGESVSKIAEQLDINQLIKPLFTATKETNLASDALSGIGDVFKGLQEAAGVVRQVGQLGQQVSTLRGSINQLTGTVTYLGNLGEGGNPNSASINYIGTVGTYSSVGQSTFVNRSGVATSTESTDNSTQEERDTVATPAKDAIRAHQAAMTKVQGQLSQIDSYVNQYQNFITGITTCTQNIRESQGYMPASDDNRITNFTNRTDAKKREVLEPVTSQTTPVRSKITTTNTFLANTINAITASRNISRIISLFQDYRDAISRGVILPPEVSDTLDLVLFQKVPPMQKEARGESDPTTGTEPIKTIFDECEDYLQQVNARGGNVGSGG
jgi:hypothetical protein